MVHIGLRGIRVLPIVSYVGSKCEFIVSRSARCRAVFCVLKPYCVECNHKLQ